MLTRHSLKLFRLREKKRLTNNLKKKNVKVAREARKPNQTGRKSESEEAILTNVDDFLA